MSRSDAARLGPSSFIYDSERLMLVGPFRSNREASEFIEGLAEPSGVEVVDSSTVELMRAFADTVGQALKQASPSSYCRQVRPVERAQEANGGFEAA